MPADAEREQPMPETTCRSCEKCTTRPCSSGAIDRLPPFCPTAALDPALAEQSLDIYRSDERTHALMVCAASVEADFYGKMTRVEETLAFIKRQNFGLVGVATCVGLLNEARLFCSLLDKHAIPHIAAGCKIGAVDKEALGIPARYKLNGPCRHESACNPVLQALYLNAARTDFNVVIGLCVGHDSLFLQRSAAPATVLIAKDRVLGHNPAAALYTLKSYYRRLEQPDDAPENGRS